nr:hypothetical protein [Tanacetum cinerariifolium]
AEEQPLPAAVSPTAESPGYIMESEPEMEPEKNDGDGEKSEEDSIDCPTSGGDNDANDDGDDLSEDDDDDKDEEESSDSEEEEEEHLAPIVSAPALHTTPPPFGYRVDTRISVQPHILMSFRSKSEVKRLLAIPTPPLSPVSPTSYPLPPFLMPLTIFTPLHTSSFPLPFSIPSTSGSEIIPEADIPLRKRARFTTPTSRYKIGESFVVAAAARQIRPTLTIADKCRADDKLIGRLRRESVVNGDTSNTTGTGPRTVRPPRECTYKDYLNCGPLKFNGTEGVIGSGEKPYRGTKPLCPKCNFYHDGPCRPKCTNCKKTGHLTRDCRSQAANPNYNNNNNNLRATVAYQGVPTCFECGAQGHLKNNCPRLGNKNQGNQNQAGNGNAVARAYRLGTAGGNPNANVVT